MYEAHWTAGHLDACVFACEFLMSRPKSLPKKAVMHVKVTDADNLAKVVL